MKYRYKVSTDEIYDENHHTHKIYGIEVCLGEKITKFRETNNELSSIHLNESYIRGAKDCVALLKKLGVI